MQNIFNLKLYKEGLKKIRLVGIIAGIVMILANAIVPLVRLLDTDAETYEKVVQMDRFAVPSILILFLTPFFFLSMYSYLNKRNESDFYHAIPYKRSCVLFSFLAAIFTWLWGILLVSLLVTGGLWAICPNTTVAFSAIPKLFGLYAFSSLYVGGFILLGMTLTGTIVSNIAVSGVLLLFVRVVSMLFSVVLEGLVPIFDLAYSPMRIFSLRYWLPAALLQSFYDTSIFREVGLWVYSAVITLLLYVLASVMYCRRKSESANKSAPSKRFQHIYRCAFTIPFALLATLGIIFHELDVFITLTIMAVVAYFLYELITTKNLRSAGRCAPLLIVPILCAGLFVGGCYLIRGSVLENAYKPEEIQSIRSYRYASMFDLFDESSGLYENVVTQSIKIQDEEAIKIVSEGLQKSIEDVKNGRYYVYAGDTVDQYIEITLQSGRKIGRRLRLSGNAYEKLQERKNSTQEFLNAYISIPCYEDITVIYAEYAEEASYEELKTLWELFTEEYNALSADEKLAFKNASDHYGADEYSLNIRGRGSIDSSAFTFSYNIPTSFVKTRAYHNQLMQKNRNTVREEINRVLSGAYNETLGAETELSFSVTAVNPYHPFSLSLDPYMDGDPIKQYTKRLQALLPYLTDEPTDDRFCIVSFFRYDYNEGENQHYSTIFGLREMTEEEAKSFMQEVGSSSILAEKMIEIVKGCATNAYPYNIDEFSLRAEHIKIDCSGLINMDTQTEETLRKACEILLPHLMISDYHTNCTVSVVYQDGTIDLAELYLDWNALTSDEIASLSELGLVDQE